MKQFKQDRRGIAHVMLIIIVVVVAAIAGVGYMVYSRNKDKGSSTGTVSTNREAESECLKAYNDKDLCKFASNYNGGKGPYKATFTNTSKDGKATTMIMEVDNKDNSSMVTKEGDKETAAFVYLNGESYIKDVASNTWTKYPKTETSTKTESPTSDLKIETKNEGKPEAQKITYKKLGKEKCGNATCFKYQVIDPAAPKSESIVWFGDKDYVLRKWSFKDEDGSLSVGEFSYSAVTINTPSPVKDAPSVPDQAELQRMIQEAQNAAEQ